MLWSFYTWYTSNYFQNFYRISAVLFFPCIPSYTLAAFYISYNLGSVAVAAHSATLYRTRHADMGKLQKTLVGTDSLKFLLIPQCIYLKTFGQFFWRKTWYNKKGKYSSTRNCDTFATSLFFFRSVAPFHRKMGQTVLALSFSDF